MEDIEKTLIKNILLKNYIEVILNKENITGKLQLPLTAVLIGISVIY